MTDPLATLAVMIASRHVELDVQEALCRRVEAFVERFNAENPPEPDDPPMTFKEGITNLLEGGLEADEAEHGLIGYLDGRVVEASPYQRERRRLLIERQRARRSQQ